MLQNDVNMRAASQNDDLIPYREKSDTSNARQSPLRIFTQQSIDTLKQVHYPYHSIYIRRHSCIKQFEGRPVTRRNPSDMPEHSQSPTRLRPNDYEIRNLMCSDELTKVHQFKDCGERRQHNNKNKEMADTEQVVDTEHVDTKHVGSSEHEIGDELASGRDKDNLSIDRRNEASNIECICVGPVVNQKKPNPQSLAAKLINESESFKNSMYEHEYLQFALRITEDIIKNDLYSNAEIKRVFNSHVEANRGRLEMDKMRDQIKELALELNLSYEDLLLDAGVPGLFGIDSCDPGCKCCGPSDLQECSSDCQERSNACLDYETRICDAKTGPGRGEIETKDGTREKNMCQTTTNVRTGSRRKPKVDNVISCHTHAHTILSAPSSFYMKDGCPKRRQPYGSSKVTRHYIQVHTHRPRRASKESEERIDTAEKELGSTEMHSTTYSAISGILRRSGSQSPKSISRTRIVRHHDKVPRHHSSSRIRSKSKLDHRIRSRTSPLSMEQRSSSRTKLNRHNTSLSSHLSLQPIKSRLRNNSRIGSKTGLNHHSKSKGHLSSSHNFENHDEHKKDYKRNLPSVSSESIEVTKKRHHKKRLEGGPKHKSKVSIASGDGSVWSGARLRKHKTHRVPLHVSISKLSDEIEAKERSIQVLSDENEDVNDVTLSVRSSPVSSPPILYNNSKNENKKYVMDGGSFTVDIVVQTEEVNLTTTPQQMICPTLTEETQTCSYNGLHQQTQEAADRGYIMLPGPIYVPKQIVGLPPPIYPSGLKTIQVAPAMSVYPNWQDANRKYIRKSTDRDSYAQTTGEINICKCPLPTSTKKCTYATCPALKDFKKDDLLLTDDYDAGVPSSISHFFPSICTQTTSSDFLMIDKILEARQAIPPCASRQSVTIDVRQAIPESEVLTKDTPNQRRTSIPITIQLITSAQQLPRVEVIDALASNTDVAPKNLDSAPIIAKVSNGIPLKTAQGNMPIVSAKLSMHTGDDEDEEMQVEEEEIKFTTANEQEIDQEVAADKVVNDEKPVSSSVEHEDNEDNSVEQLKCESDTSKKEGPQQQADASEHLELLQKSVTIIDYPQKSEIYPGGNESEAIMVGKADDDEDDFMTKLDFKPNMSMTTSMEQRIKKVVHESELFRHPEERRISWSGEAGIDLSANVINTIAEGDEHEESSAEKISILENENRLQSTTDCSKPMKPTVRSSTFVKPDAREREETAGEDTDTED